MKQIKPLAENKNLIDLINKLDAFLPEQVFYALSKKVVMTSIECVVLKGGDDHREVLLTKRSSKDPFFPNLWHLPGAMLRPSDKSYDDALHRIAQEELDTEISKTIFSRIVFDSIDVRGPINRIAFICKLKNESKVGSYYKLSDLPKDLVAGHLMLLQEIAIA